MALNREQFVQKVIDIVHARFPLARVARADKSFALKINGHVVVLESLYRSTQISPDDMTHNVERWTTEVIRAGEGMPIQNETFETLAPTIFPLLVSGAPEVQTPNAILTTPFLEGLSVAYVIDSARTISYIPKSIFDGWGISVDELHERALENLSAKSDSIGASAGQDEAGDVSLILFQTLDGFDATRVLLPTLHGRLREYLGSPFCAGVPNRDLLVCFRNEPQTIERMREKIGQDYRTMPHQISEKLLLVTADGVAPLD